MIVEKDKVISILYNAIDSNSGENLDNNDGDSLLEFVVGKYTIVPGLDKALLGLNIGDKKDILLDAKDAFGDINEEAFKEYPITEFDGLKLKIGMTLANVDKNGQEILVKVAGFDDEIVKIDYNHPLAGKKIKFNVQVVDLREANETELRTGKVKKKNDSCGCSGCGCH